MRNAYDDDVVFEEEILSDSDFSDRLLEEEEEQELQRVLFGSAGGAGGSGAWTSGPGAWHWLAG